MHPTPGTRVSVFERGVRRSEFSPGGPCPLPRSDSLTDRQDIPVLYHLKASNYNEKARWALDFKGIAHRRVAFEPGRHRRAAQRIAGIDTLPAIELRGEAIGDSTAIIAALERHKPEPPLYPEGDPERQRALELEEHFDEQVGPDSRRLAIGHISTHGALFLSTFTPDMGEPRRTIAKALFPAVRRKLRSDFKIDGETVAGAFAKIREAGELVRSEASPDGYLVGGRFTVADLALASLLAPITCPPEFPYPQPQRDHPALAPVREALAEAGLYDWVRGMYARHRGRSAEVAA